MEKMRQPETETSLVKLREWGANTAIVLGSGLNTLISAEDQTRAVSYSKFGELPKSSVPGHVGQFVLGNVGGSQVIFAQGRVHLYEGRSPHDVTAIVRMLAEAGIKTLILTNAAGSANRSFAPGGWMMIADHINLTGTTPLMGRPDFIDMTDAYSARLREKFALAAAKARIVLWEGVYAGLLGPQYETPAEVRMLQALGADAVGMSTVLETIQARSLGLEVAAFSCLTNFAAGISATKLTHEEVLETGKAAADIFARLLAAALPTL
jgi:purine-nucleoside phosphorylase